MSREIFFRVLNIHFCTRRKMTDLLCCDVFSYSLKIKGTAVKPSLKFSSALSHPFAFAVQFAVFGKSYHKTGLVAANLYLREMMKNSAGEVEIVCSHCSRSCLHYDEHECARIATRWLTPNSYWLVIIEGPINQLNRSSWLATFDTSPNMSIVLQPTPFKISWREFAFA